MPPSAVVDYDIGLHRLVSPDGSAAVAEAALDPSSAAAGGDIDSDDDEALRLRNEQHGQMILEMDSDNILLQVGTPRGRQRRGRA